MHELDYRSRASALAGVPDVVVSTQRVLPREARHVDVILKDHDVAHVVAAIKSSRSICHDHSLYAQEVEDPHRVRHLEGQMRCASDTRGRRSGCRFVSVLVRLEKIYKIT